MKERSLPPGIKTAPILAFASVRIVLTPGEVQVLPVIVRLIGLHARPADLRHEQPGNSKGVVADQFRIQAEGALPASWRL